MRTEYHESDRSSPKICSSIQAWANVFSARGTRSKLAARATPAITRCTCLTLFIVAIETNYYNLAGVALIFSVIGDDLREQEGCQILRQQSPRLTHPESWARQSGLLPKSMEVTALHLELKPISIIATYRLQSTR